MDSAAHFENAVPFVPLARGDEVYVVKVYDGDTVTLAWNHRGAPVKLSTRILGIDTPELRSSNAKEKEMALCAKQALSDLCLGKWVTVASDAHMDKYGRLLTDLRLPDGRSVATHMLALGDICRAYDGGTRQPWFTEE